MSEGVPVTDVPGPPAGSPRAEEDSSYDDDVSPPANRMVIAVFALFGVLISLYMLLYHLGMLGSILCGSGGCETVQNSPWANFLGVPVPLIGLLGYGALMAAALAGLQPALAGDRRIPLVLVTGAVIALVFTAYLNYIEAFVIRAWCRWCIGSAVVVGVLFLATIPEFARTRGRHA